MPLPAPGLPSEEHEDKDHAPGHNMGSDWSIQFRPSNIFPFEWYKEWKTQAQYF